jgi:MoaA/NifB/PqqE/SkfB family radical SAM enzyme
MHPTQLVRSGVAAARMLATGKATPVNAMVALTNACNSRCGYCDIYARGEEGEMTLDELRALLSALKSRGTSRVGLWGGEPLLRPDIGEIADHCHELGMWTTIDTNGYLFPRLYDRLQMVDHWMFSIDGRAPSHERNREAGSHPKVMRAIDHAADVGAHFWMLSVLSRNNLDDIDWMLDLAEARGARVIFQVLHHAEAHDGGKGKAILPVDEAYRGALKKLLRAREAGRPVGNSEVGLRYLLDWPDFAVPRGDAPHKGVRCVAGHLYVNIDANGRVFPCSLLVDEVQAADWRQVGLDAALAKATEPRSCAACSATAFSEYNLLYGLDPQTILSWLQALRG